MKWSLTRPDEVIASTANSNNLNDDGAVISNDPIEDHWAVLLLRGDGDIVYQPP